MDDYVEDLNYNNCFWMKSGILYSHANAKYEEYKSIGKIFKTLSEGIKRFYETLQTLPSLHKPTDSDSTRSKGIDSFIEIIKKMTNSFKNFYHETKKITKNIEDKNISFESKQKALDMCEEDHQKYKAEIEQLTKKKELYYEAMNKAVETFLTSNSSNVIYKIKSRGQKNLKNLVTFAQKKKEEYKNQIKVVEERRVNYMKIQGNIFADQEEFERDCTNEFKDNLLKFIDSIKNFKNSIQINEKEMEIINEIDGDKDNKAFAEKNKSYMTGPKRNLFKEYSQDMNYYSENFDYVKNKLKNKNPSEIRETQNKLTKEIKEFLSEVIKEEPDEIHNKILDIAKSLKENNLTDDDYDYLITKFQERYNQFLKWKEEIVGYQDYNKVGSELDDRFCYMQTFLNYFNKTRVDNKELNKKNYDFLCGAMKKILELNSNEDIDYALCDLVVILSSTFYTIDPNNKDKKIYVNEVIKKCPIIQKQGFWVGLTKFELNEEIQGRNKEEDTLKEQNLSEDKLNNSKMAKLMSVSYNIMQFVSDSNLFNKIICDIFKYCNIEKDNREIIIGMMEVQIESDSTKELVLNKNLLLNGK